MGLLDKIGSGIKSVVNGVKSIPEKVVSGAGEVLTFGGRALTAASDAISSGFSAFAGGVGQVASAVGGVVKGVAGLTVDGLSAIASGAAKVGGVVVDAAKSLLGNFGLLDLAGGKDGTVSEQTLSTFGTILAAVKGQGDPQVAAAVQAFLANPSAPIQLDPAKYGDVIAALQNIATDEAGLASFQQLLANPQQLDQLLAATQQAPALMNQQRMYEQHNQTRNEAFKAEREALRQEVLTVPDENLEQVLHKVEEQIRQNPNDESLRKLHHLAQRKWDDYQRRSNLDMSQGEAFQETRSFEELQALSAEGMGEARSQEDLTRWQSMQGQALEGMRNQEFVKTLADQARSQEDAGQLAQAEATVLQMSQLSRQHFGAAPPDSVTEFLDKLHGGFYNQQPEGGARPVAPRGSLPRLGAQMWGGQGGGNPAN